MTDAIHNFTTNLIAFHRPIKRSYFILTWNGDQRKWHPYRDDLPNLLMRRSSINRSGKVNINVATSRTATPTLIEVNSEGYFLMSNNIKITLVRQTGNALPPPFVKKEYTLANPGEIAVSVQERLWNLAPPGPPPGPPPGQQANLVATTATANATYTHVIHQVLKPIPRRIAWLVAEDACKNNEACPISTNEISPITAAVTTCFHVFESEHLSEWFARHPVRTKCPVCREVCQMTKAYSGADEL
jgi:hypothetical protein